MHSCQPLNLAVAAILRHNPLANRRLLYTRRKLCENLPVYIPAMCSVRLQLLQLLLIRDVLNVVYSLQLVVHGVGKV